MTAPTPRPERATQDRVVALFTDTACASNLDYRNLGHWVNRDGNRCIEANLLRARMKHAR